MILTKQRIFLSLKSLLIQLSICKYVIIGVGVGVALYYYNIDSNNNNNNSKRSLIENKNPDFYYYISNNRNYFRKIRLGNISNKCGIFLHSPDKFYIYNRLPVQSGFLNFFTSIFYLLLPLFYILYNAITTFISKVLFVWHNKKVILSYLWGNRYIFFLTFEIENDLL